MKAAAFMQEGQVPQLSVSVNAGADSNKDGPAVGLTFSQSKYCANALAMANPPFPSFARNNKAWLTLF